MRFENECDSSVIRPQTQSGNSITSGSDVNELLLYVENDLFQSREKNRIKEAGGFIAFHGVWRVAGILATSRALGDYPLKDKKFVIADPDILSFDLSYNK